MRIISGKARGTKLFALDGVETRPTTDRVKESLFNLLQFNFYETTVLDLFSGSGALGLEAASRGADKVYCIDNSKKACEIIQRNVEKTKLEQVSVACGDVIAHIKKQTTHSIDLIFMDPPYLKDMIVPSLEAISDGNVLKQDGIVVVEHEKTDELPLKIGTLELLKSRTYGITTISIYRRVS